MLSLCSFYLSLLFVKKPGSLTKGSFEASPDSTTRRNAQNFYSSFPSLWQQSEITNVQLKFEKNDNRDMVLGREKSNYVKLSAKSVKDLNILLQTALTWGCHKGI